MEETTAHGLVQEDSTARPTAEQPFSVTRLIALERDGNRCTWDGCNATERLHVHHIKPRSEGGGDEVGNLRTLCASHHAKTHVRMADEAAAEGRAESMSSWRRETIEKLAGLSPAARELFNDLASWQQPGNEAIDVGSELRPGEFAAWGELVDAGIIRGRGRYNVRGWMVSGVRV